MAVVYKTNLKYFYILNVYNLYVFYVFELRVCEKPVRVLSVESPYEEEKFLRNPAIINSLLDTLYKTKNFETPSLE